MLFKLNWHNGNLLISQTIMLDCWNY